MGWFSWLFGGGQKAEGTAAATSANQFAVGMYFKEYVNGALSETVMIEQIRKDPEFGDSVFLSNGRCPSIDDFVAGFTNDAGNKIRYERVTAPADAEAKTKPCVLCGVQTPYKVGKGLNTIALDPVGIQKLYVICPQCCRGDTLALAKKIKGIPEQQREKSSGDL